MGLFISLGSFLSFFLSFTYFISLFICLSIYYFVMPRFFHYVLRIETSDKEKEKEYIKTQ